MDSPNILFVMADQMSAKAMPMYGHPVVRMPAISKLADEGVVFENAYCNSPLCGPSRLSMMAGLLPHKIGAYDNAPEFSAATPTFAHYLRLSGYLTCLSGKMHFAGPDQLHGFEQRLTTDIYPADFGWTPNWSEPDAKVRFQDMQNVLEAGPCARSLQIDYDDTVAFQANRWLFDRARDQNRQPFMLTVSFTSPHDPYVAHPEFWNLYQDEEIDLPAVAKLPLDEVDAHSRRIRAHYGVDQVEVSDEALRRLRRGYYAAIGYIDAKVAELMDSLQQSGLAENTIVILTSDHGDMMGERGLFYKKSFFEWAARVPLIFWAPKSFKAGRVDAPVSLLDMLPTLQALSHGSMETILEADGISLLPALEGNRLPDRVIAGEYLAEGVFAPAFMLRDHRFKLYYSESDPPLLFDMAQDSRELNNLADDPEHASRLERLTGIASGLWNTRMIKAAIIKDQHRRRLINRSQAIGQRPRWDFQPATNAAEQWVRAGKWTVEVEAAAHLDVSDSVAPADRR